MATCMPRAARLRHRGVAALMLAAALAACSGENTAQPRTASSAGPASAPVVAAATPPIQMDNPDLQASLKLDAALSADAPAAVQSLALSPASAAETETDTEALLRSLGM